MVHQPVQIIIFGFMVSLPPYSEYNTAGDQVERECFTPVKGRYPNI
jgi:hypothetical protein